MVGDLGRASGWNWSRWDVGVVQKRPGPSLESVGPNHAARLKSGISPSAAWSWVALVEQICWKRIADIIAASFYLLNLEYEQNQKDKQWTRWTAKMFASDHLRLKLLQWNQESDRFVLYEANSPKHPWFMMHWIVAGLVDLPGWVSVCVCVYFGSLFECVL